jgi:hypothetical protein
MGPKTEELIVVLDRLITLLENDKQTHWHEWIFRARTWIANSDYSGIEYLLSAYGGMGSIMDIVIGRNFIDNQFSYEADYVKLNEECSALLNKSYELAQYIKHAQS